MSPALAVEFFTTSATWDALEDPEGDSDLGNDADGGLEEAQELLGCSS